MTHVVVDSDLMLKDVRKVLGILPVSARKPSL